MGKISLYDYCQQNNKQLLLEEWDYSANTNNPVDVAYGSGKKAWWICSVCGHKWSAIISNRVRDSGCPICARRSISQKKMIPHGNSLAEKCPDIAKEWYYEKNGDLTPENVTYKSHRKVWFKCKICGTIWETRVENRVNFGCMNCRNLRTSVRNAIPKPNESLADLYPAIAAEWDFDKNDVSPEEVRPFSEKIVWWKCGVCGYSYKRMINVRTIQNSTCPKCSAKGTSYGEQYIYWTIKQCYPNAHNRYKLWGIAYDIVVSEKGTHLAIEYSGTNWHKGKEQQDKHKRLLAEQNGFVFFDIIETWEPSDVCFPNHFEVIPNSNRDESLNSIIGIILSSLGQTIDAIDLKRAKANALDYSKGTVEKEKSLSYLYPLVAKDWDYEANWPLTPDNVSAFSGTQVQWKCERGHKWSSKISSRTSNENGCPFCSNHPSIGTIQGVNDLATTHPALLPYWNSAKNGNVDPTSIRSGSYYKAWWKCPICGYEWSAIVKYKTLAKYLCPQCGQKKVIRRHETNNFRGESWVGRSKKMNCGLVATIIEDFGYHDITIQFEDGLIRYHCRKDRYKDGAIAHKA